jgi:hypothetical protein
MGMFEPAGRSLRVSRFRRLVVDLMYFSAQVPSVIIERPMRLAPLVAARGAGDPGPTWTSIFLKAYAIVSSRSPILRTAYLRFPWARFYEHPTTIAIGNVDRQLPHERIVLYAKIESPEKQSLAEIDAILRAHQEGPLESIDSYCNAVRLSWTPHLIRRFLWWGGLNVFGSLRCHHFGTFGISSLGARGAAIVQMIPLLTATLHPGLFEDDGRLLMRLSFDHRVLDGAAAAQSLVDLEAVLLGEVLEECRNHA